MEWDILLAVLQGFAALYLSYMGVQATVNPIEKFLFIAIGLVIVVIGGVQAYRNTQDMQALQTRVVAIQEDTKRISDVLIKPQLNASPSQALPERKERSMLILDTQFITGRLPPFTPTNSFIINVKYTNVSSVPARIAGVWASIYAFDHILDVVEEERIYASLYASLLDSSKGVPAQDNILGPTQYTWFTIEPKPVLNEETATRLANGKLYIYIMSLLKYNDDLGSHETELCRFFWGVRASMHQCNGHNGPRS